eukprot:CAMPEP_0182565670 /NCGR_PEP_ID=MMETSP1324-20130603/7328_1 /TAXON_ID=236786 /ORGANISM="Florenciella sp., Strain RCC1587" /LENGTH=153 /DNA_ID=CAMNT_0024779359 /DNA_START=28 /DNA_END=490 /DNA_ORIENTATION=+
MATWQEWSTEWLGGIALLVGIIAFFVAVGTTADIIGQRAKLASLETKWKKPKGALLRFEPQDAGREVNEPERKRDADGRVTAYRVSKGGSALRRFDEHTPAADERGRLKRHPMDRAASLLSGVANRGGGGELSGVLPRAFGHVRGVLDIEIVT